MTSFHDDVDAQLHDELGVDVVQTVADLLGQDLRAILRDRLDSRSTLLTGQLLDPDGPLAHATAVDVMHALHGRGDPEDYWWRTPLGRACAQALAQESTEALTHARAAAMLGVTRGTIQPMITRGYLDRHPDGGVLRSSVLRRLAR